MRTGMVGAIRRPVVVAGVFSLLAGCAAVKPEPSADTTQVPSALSALPGAQTAATGKLQPYSVYQNDDVAPLAPPRLFEAEQSSPSQAAADFEGRPLMSGGLPVDNAPLTLAAVYDMALNNDPQLRAAYDGLQAAGYDVKAARAGLLPSINIEGSYSNVNQNVNKSQNTVYQHGKASWNEHAYALTLNQPVFDAGIYHKWKQSQESERKEVAGYASAQQDLMLRASTAYLSILAAIDQLELTEAERGVTLKQMELVRARYQSGQETEVGLSEVQARLDLQEANYLLAQNAFHDRQQALHEIIGYGNLDLMPVRPNIDLLLPEPNDPHAWLKQALEYNWSLREAAAQVAVAAREVSVQRSGYYPTLNLKSSSGRNDTGGSLFGGGSNVSDTRVVLSLNIPVYQGGHTQNMSRAAASRLSAAQQQLDLARRKIQRQVFSSFQGISSGVGRIRALQSSVAAFEQAQQLQSERFEYGLTDIVSVLDATRNLYNAKRQEAEARYNYILETLKLKQAAGILSDRDIVSISNSIS